MLYYNHKRGQGKDRKTGEGIAMTVMYETSVKDFKFWGPAHEHAAKLTDEEWEILEETFEGHTVDRTDLNDTFAYYFEEICELLGVSEEEVLAR